MEKHVADAPGFLRFELNLMRAMLDQLVPALDAMDAAALTTANIQQIPDAQGVYQLLHDGKAKYIGKTDAQAGLRVRLMRHRRKFLHRREITDEDVTFRAVQVFVLTAIDVETELISHYDTKQHWNTSGFGSNDPGQERETTNKPPEGFDAQFPINIDLMDSFVPAGEYSVADLLRRLKAALPYTFRYQTAGSGSGRRNLSPHPDFVAARVTVPPGLHTTRELVRLALAVLPPGWQATEFVSHVILYKENRTYIHGRAI